MATTDTDLRVQLSHTIDDYETMRTKAKRELTRAYELLSLAAHAVNHNSPAIADEFIDRAMTMVNTSITALTLPRNTD